MINQNSKCSSTWPRSVISDPLPDLVDSFQPPAPVLSTEDLLEWRQSTNVDSMLMKYCLYVKMDEFESRHFPNPGKMVTIDVLALLDELAGAKAELQMNAKRERDEAEVVDLDADISFRFNTCLKCAKIQGGFYTDCDYCIKYYGAKRDKARRQIKALTPLKDE